MIFLLQLVDDARLSRSYEDCWLALRSSARVCQAMYVRTIFLVLCMHKGAQCSHKVRCACGHGSYKGVCPYACVGVAIVIAQLWCNRTTYNICE